VFLFSGMHGIVDDAYLKKSGSSGAAWSSGYSRSVSEPQDCILVTAWIVRLGLASGSKTSIAHISAPPMTSNAP